MPLRLFLSIPLWLLDRCSRLWCTIPNLYDQKQWSFW